jgi:hypothetical protein
VRYPPVSVSGFPPPPSIFSEGGAESAMDFLDSEAEGRPDRILAMAPRSLFAPRRFPRAQAYPRPYFLWKYGNTCSPISSITLSCL